ncbi:hypothetical protein CEXT_137601 [Caerostris extrusa]|uniref:Uncharacterized protein n=1 Tax=Caerostris extrusa TaxID=172846 RepID=A0AAV4Y4X0_CAEEX|nr:hypothetical protein CEXT_137601 [Caerostris extrusa]
MKWHQHNLPQTLKWTLQREIKMSPIQLRNHFQIPPKRLTCRDQTQDPSTKDPEIKNQFSPLNQMDSENSVAMPEKKIHMPPFFITPNESWPETCKVLTSTVESSSFIQRTIP